MAQETQNKHKLDPIYSRRQQKLSNILEQRELNGLALNPGPSLTYLTGMHFHLSERPVVALFSIAKPALFILPNLESAKLANLDFPFASITYDEDPDLWPKVFSEGLRASGLNDQKIGVESTRMRVLELFLLQKASENTQFLPANQTVADLRMIKDSREKESMRTAVIIAQNAINSAIGSFKVGMTEREFAAELTLQLLKHGSDSEFPFPPIVSSGPNSANPHAVPSDRQIQEGNLLVVDWGASFKGYISDLTRTFAIGKVEPEYDKIAAIVGQANAAGRDACHPNASAESIDRAARSVIDAAGYGKFFFHRTGHGIGMEAHEDPYIRSGNQLKLQPGMSFTVEPGIYLPDRGGVRIEDNVIITEEGVECLSNLPRELTTLPR